VDEPARAGVRAAPGLSDLPAEERLPWQTLWDDVAAARTKDPRAPGRPRGNSLAIPRNNFARRSARRAKTDHWELGRYAGRGPPLT
jgi:hypothetical protein